MDFAGAISRGGQDRFLFRVVVPHAAGALWPTREPSRRGIGGAFGHLPRGRLVESSAEVQCAGHLSYTVEYRRKAGGSCPFRLSRGSLSRGAVDSRNRRRIARRPGAVPVIAPQHFVKNRSMARKPLAPRFVG